MNSTPLDRDPAIRLDRLRRTFSTPKGAVVALDDMDLEIASGQLVALLGENGAGKTTLTKVLSTLLFPSGGTAQVFGHDIVRGAKRVRELTTVVFGGDRGLYEMLDGVENLRYFGALHGVGRRDLVVAIPGLLEQVGLADAARRPVRTYSKGMKQRLHLAVGLLTRPRLLLLDEPTVGLDPNEADRLRGVVAQMHADGTTVLLTSHNLLDVERLAERVVMVSHGRITHDMSLPEFRRLSGVEAIVTAIVENDAGVQEERRYPVERWTAEALQQLGIQLNGVRVLDLQVRPSSLEEAFALASGVRPSERS